MTQNGRRAVTVLHAGGLGFEDHPAPVRIDHDLTLRPFWSTVSPVDDGREQFGLSKNRQIACRCTRCQEFQVTDLLGPYGLFDVMPHQARLKEHRQVLRPKETPRATYEESDRPVRSGAGVQTA